MPLPPGFGIFSVNAGVAPCEAARRVVAPYGRHRPRKAGGHRGPPVPRCGTFSRSSRRGGACPSRRVLERPRPACPDPHPLPRLAGTRRGSEIVPAEILHRTRAQWPGKIKTVFCAPELLWKGVGVSPVNGGRGVERLWAGTPIGAHPRRSFGFFPIAGQETRPAGRNPARRRAESSRPTASRSAGEGRVRRPAPTAFQADCSRTGQWEGQAPPLRDGWGDIPRRRTSGRPHGAAPYGVSLRPAR